LETHQYTTPRAIDDEFLHACGITTEFYDALRYVGWEEFPEMVEDGSAILTAEFLCTLQILDDNSHWRVKYKFRLLGRSFTLSISEMSTALKFNPHARSKIDALPRFAPDAFCREIGELTSVQPRYSQIFNPTLRVVNRWIAQHLNPRNDTRAVNRMDRAYLYAVVKKLETNPTYFLLNHWLEIAFNTENTISFTPFGTRISLHLGVLGDASVAYLPAAPVIGEAFFVQAHLCRRVGDTIYACYPGHSTEIVLPNPQLGLYSGNPLCIRLQDP
jgi:hypothetical protein